MATKVLFICGVFAEENIDELASKAVGTIEYSANTFQERLINGFIKNKLDISIVSAPFIGAYPMRSKEIYFKGFTKKQNKYEYVPFFNIWGMRNFSRAYSVKKKIKSFVKEQTSDRKLIVVYSAHEPFLEAAVWAKKQDPQVKICFVVPDLPQYMNLESKRSCMYDFLKKVDIARMNKCIKVVDSFVLLTEQMKDVLNVGKRPALIVEGIIDEELGIQVDSSHSESDIKNIVYTGKLNEKFGVKNLIDAFHGCSEKNYRLVLVGDGDCVPYIEKMIQKDNRIIYTGQVSPKEAKRWQETADVLVNPRTNNEEYTKYSFPSKTIEYLKTGKPVVAYMLDGMKDIYREFLYVIEEEEGSEMIAISKAINSCDKEGKYMKFMQYADESLGTINVVKEILKMN